MDQLDSLLLSIDEQKTRTWHMDGDRSSFDDLTLIFFDSDHSYSVSTHVVCIGKNSSSVLQSFCESENNNKTCNLTSMIPSGISSADVSNCLNFIYDIQIDDANYVSLYMLAKILKIPQLLKLCIEEIRNCDLWTAARNLKTHDNLSSESSDSDLVVLELQPIVDYCLQFCASNVALLLKNNSVDSFFEVLGASRILHVQKILTKAVEKKTLSNLQVCNFVVACSRVQDTVFPLLADLIIEIDPIDAVFVHVLSKKFEMSSNLNVLCAPFLVEGELSKNFNTYYEDLGLLHASEHGMLLDLLDRDDLNASCEDEVFDVVLSFNTTNASHLTSTEVCDMWARVRTTHCTSSAILQLADIVGATSKWTRIGFAGMAVLHEKGAAGLNSFIEERWRVAKFKRKRIDEGGKEEGCNAIEIAAIECKRLTHRASYMYDPNLMCAAAEDKDDDEMNQCMADLEADAQAGAAYMEKFVAQFTSNSSSKDNKDENDEHFIVEDIVMKLVAMTEDSFTCNTNGIC